MKKLVWTPEQKKWALTACLLATLSLNLGHLFDGVDGARGEATMASIDLPADVEHSRHETTVPAPRGEAKDAPAVTIVEKVTPPRNDTPPAPKLAPIPAERIAASTEQASKIKINGEEIDVIFFKRTDGRTLVTFKNEDNDPRIKAAKEANLIATTEGTAFCAACHGWGSRTIPVQFTENLEAMKAVAVETLQKDIETILKTVKKNEKVDDETKDHQELAKKSYEKMTAEERETRAEHLVEEFEAKLEKECDDRIDEAKGDKLLKCYTDKMSRFFKDSENKKFFKKYGATEVKNLVDSKINKQLTSALVSSQFSSTVVDQIEKIQKALPGRAEDARKSVMQASIAATRTQISTLSQALTAARNRFNDPRATFAQKQAAFNELAKLSREEKEFNYRVLPKELSDMRAEHRQGIASALEGSSDSQLRKDLNNYYDDLAARVFDRLGTDGLEANGLGIPKNSGTSTGSQTYRNGVSALKTGQALPLPNKSTAARPANNGTRPSTGVNPNGTRIAAPALNTSL